MKFDSLKQFSEKAREKNKAAPDIELIRQTIVGSLFELDAIATKVQNQLPSGSFNTDDYRTLRDISIFLYRWFRPVLLKEFKDEKVIQTIEDYIKNPKPKKSIDVLTLLRFTDLLIEFAYRKGIINIFQLNIPTTIQDEETDSD